MRRLIFSIIILSSTCALAGIYDLPQAELVMNKKYDISSEYSAQLGYLPVGAFNKYIGLGGSYLKLFNETHGWEVANVIIPIEIQTNLKKVLISDITYGASEDDFAVLKAMITTGYFYSPFYTKSLLFNSNLIRSQLSFVTSAGAAIFNIGTIPTGSLGIVQRFFYGEKSSISFDARYYAFLTNRDNVRSQISLMAVFSFGIGNKK